MMIVNLIHNARPRSPVSCCDGCYEGLLVASASTKYRQTAECISLVAAIAITRHGVIFLTRFCVGL